MDLNVDEFIDGLFSKEAVDQPSDTKKFEEDDLDLPIWFEEKKFNQARRFFWDNCFHICSSMLYGLVAVFAIPSILRVLVGTKRSNSLYTAFKRYHSTFLHTISWFENELKPGTDSWRSLAAVRNRHFRAGLSSKLKGLGAISQRDLALTQFGFMGFVTLKPDLFSVRQMEDGDWEAYIHFWRTIGYVLGIEDRYNICRKNYQETREVCQIILDRVFTPCLTNVPEYFEHMARSMLDGLWSINPIINIDAMIYWTRYLANVPGYVYTESDRISIERKITEELKGKSQDIGVDASTLIAKPLIEIPNRNKRLLYLDNYRSMEDVPQFKQLRISSKYRLGFYWIICAFYSTYLGRMFFNAHLRWSIILIKYLPFLGFFRFGVLASYCNIFAEDPTDNVEPKPNSEYETPKVVPWYREVLDML